MNSRKNWNEEVRRADDDDADSPFPVWTPERGGCEGMQAIGPWQQGQEEKESSSSSSAAAAVKDDVVPLDDAFEQLYWYEHDQRRFPHSKEIPLEQQSTTQSESETTDN